MMPDILPVRLLLKALLIFVILNVTFAALNPPVGRLSLFNGLVSGRSRLPAVNPAGQDFRIGDVDALFASHMISNTAKASTEYRVLLLGDSQTWGWLVSSSETLSAYLNQRDWTACKRDVRFYNLAYPTPSVLRDFFYLHEGLEYKPDLVIWMVTLESFRPRPIEDLVLDLNPKTRFGLLPAYGLERYQSLVGQPLEFGDSMFVGQRRHLKSLVLLQMYGSIWDATGIDYRVSDASTESAAANQPRTSRTSEQPGTTALHPSDLTFDVLKAGQTMLNGVPMLVVNEPIPISADPALRYNSKYLSQSYDPYQRNLQNYTSSAGIQFLDYYDQIPASEFPAGNLHLSARAEKEVAKFLTPEVFKIACP